MLAKSANRARQRWNLRTDANEIRNPKQIPMKKKANFKTKAPGHAPWLFETFSHSNLTACFGFRISDFNTVSHRWPTADMSLKAFHIVFVTASIVLAVLFGVWSLVNYFQ